MSLSAIKGCWAKIVTPLGLRIERKTDKAPTQAKEGWVGHPAFIGPHTGWCSGQTHPSAAFSLSLIARHNPGE